MGLFGWVKYYWKYVFNYKHYKQLLNKDNIDDQIGHNVYGKMETMKQYIKRHHFLHAWVKNALIVPGAMLMKRYFGKYLQKEVPDHPQFANMKIFSDSFDEAVEHWVRYHVMENQKTRKDARKNRSFEDTMKIHSVDILIVLKRALLTMASQDTAYTEFLNLLTFRIASKMNELHEPVINHVFYNNQKIQCVRYFAIRHNVGLSFNPDKAFKDAINAGKTVTVDPVQLNMLLLEHLNKTPAEMKAHLSDMEKVMAERREEIKKHLKKQESGLRKTHNKTASEHRKVRRKVQKSRPVKRTKKARR